MNTNLTFEELAKQQQKILASMGPVTLEDAKKQIMGKIEKKRKKLQERLDFLEEEMYKELKQKTSDTKEISLSEYQRKIEALRKELALIA